MVFKIPIGTHSQNAVHIIRHGHTRGSSRNTLLPNLQGSIGTRNLLRCRLYLRRGLTFFIDQREKRLEEQRKASLEKRREHYGQISRMVESIIALGVEGPSRENRAAGLKLQFGLSALRMQQLAHEVLIPNRGYESTLKHLAKDLPGYPEALNQVEAEVEKFNFQVSEIEASVEKKLKASLEAIAPLFDEYPYVNGINLLQVRKTLWNVWLDYVFRHNSIEPIEGPFVRYSGEQRWQRQGNSLMLIDSFIATLTSEESFSKVRSIIESFLENKETIERLVSLKETAKLSPKLNLTLKSYVRAAFELVRRIEANTYTTELDCCPKK